MLFSFLRFHDSSYARVYGCFSKNGVAYFGQGGTADQMAEDPLAGIKERIYGCDFESKEVRIFESLFRSERM